MRHAAAMAGLALGLMSGSAHAAMFNYDVGFGQGTFVTPGTSQNYQVTGSIVTDKDSGIISQSDILSYIFTVTAGDNRSGPYAEDSATFDNTDSILAISGSDLVASSNKLVFNYSGDGGTFSSGFIINGFTLNAGDAMTNPNASADVFPYYASFDQASGSSMQVASRSSALPTVPLPASAPMFGAALVALGAIGYGLKRKGKAAA